MVICLHYCNVLRKYNRDMPNHGESFFPENVPLPESRADSFVFSQEFTAYTSIPMDRRPEEIPLPPSVAVSRNVSTASLSALSQAQILSGSNVSIGHSIGASSIQASQDLKAPQNQVKKRARAGSRASGPAPGSLVSKRPEDIPLPPSRIASHLSLQSIQMEPEENSIQEYVAAAISRANSARTLSQVLPYNVPLPLSRSFSHTSSIMQQNDNAAQVQKRSSREMFESTKPEDIPLPLSRALSSASIFSTLSHKSHSRQIEQITTQAWNQFYPHEIPLPPSGPGSRSYSNTSLVSHQQVVQPEQGHTQSTEPDGYADDNYEAEDDYEQAYEEDFQDYNEEFDAEEGSHSQSTEEHYDQSFQSRPEDIPLPESHQGSVSSLRQSLHDFQQALDCDQDAALDHPPPQETSIPANDTTEAESSLQRSHSAQRFAGSTESMKRSQSSVHQHPEQIALPMSREGSLYSVRSEVSVRAAKHPSETNLGSRQLTNNSPRSLTNLRHPHDVPLPMSRGSSNATLTSKPGSRLMSRATSRSASGHFASSELVEKISQHGSREQFFAHEQDILSNVRNPQDIPLPMSRGSSNATLSSKVGSRHTSRAPSRSASGQFGPSEPFGTINEPGHVNEALAQQEKSLMRSPQDVPLPMSRGSSNATLASSRHTSRAPSRSASGQFITSEPVGMPLHSNGDEALAHHHDPSLTQVRNPQDVPLPMSRGSSNATLSSKPGSRHASRGPSRTASGQITPSDLNGATPQHGIVDEALTRQQESLRRSVSGVLKYKSKSNSSLRKEQSSESLTKNVESTSSRKGSITGSKPILHQKGGRASNAPSRNLSRAGSTSSLHKKVLTTMSRKASMELLSEKTKHVEKQSSQPALQHGRENSVPATQQPTTSSKSRSSSSASLVKETQSHPQNPSSQPSSRPLSRAASNSSLKYRQHATEIPEALPKDIPLPESRPGSTYSSAASLSEKQQVRHSSSFIPATEENTPLDPNQEDQHVVLLPHEIMLPASRFGSTYSIANDTTSRSQSVANIQSSVKNSRSLTGLENSHVEERLPEQNDEGLFDTNDASTSVRPEDIPLPLSQAGSLSYGSVYFDQKRSDPHSNETAIAEVEKPLEKHKSTSRVSINAPIQPKEDTQSRPTSRPTSRRPSSSRIRQVQPEEIPLPDSRISSVYASRVSLKNTDEKSTPIYHNSESSLREAYNIPLPPSAPESRTQSVASLPTANSNLGSQKLNKGSQSIARGSRPSSRMSSRASSKSQLRETVKDMVPTKPPSKPPSVNASPRSSRISLMKDNTTDYTTTNNNVDNGKNQSENVLSSEEIAEDQTIHKTNVESSPLPQSASRTQSQASLTKVERQTSSKSVEESQPHSRTQSQKSLEEDSAVSESGNPTDDEEVIRKLTEAVTEAIKGAEEQFPADSQGDNEYTEGEDDSEYYEEGEEEEQIDEGETSNHYEQNEEDVDDEEIQQMRYVINFHNQMNIINEQSPVLSEMMRRKKEIRERYYTAQPYAALYEFHLFYLLILLI
jgi:hypothetical protein